MEVPSFAITILFFPTHFGIHMMHFVLHGYDGASNHSGFAAPGLLGYFFNGEYHYYHRKSWTKCNHTILRQYLLELTS